MPRFADVMLRIDVQQIGIAVDLLDRNAAYGRRLTPWRRAMPVERGYHNRLRLKDSSRNGLLYEQTGNSDRIFRLLKIVSYVTIPSLGGRYGLQPIMKHWAPCWTRRLNRIEVVLRQLISLSWFHDD